MHKLLVNQALYSQGLQATQVLGTFFDGIARHTPEGFEFARRAAAGGFQARPFASATSRSATSGSSTVSRYFKRFSGQTATRSLPSGGLTSD